MTLVALALVGCPAERGPREVTARPEGVDPGRTATVEPRAGRLGVRARLPYEDIAALAASALPERHPVAGSREVCKRLLGVRLCGTASWNVTLRRTAAPALAADGDRVAVTLPLRFDGDVGVGGRVARALGLHALEVRGAAIATARLGLDVDAEWCPRPELDVAWHWSERPELGWTRGIELDLRGLLDEAIAARLETLDERVETLIDCAALRARLAPLWREHHVELALPDGRETWLHVRPQAFGFAGVRAEPDALGVGFALEATTLVDDETPPAAAEPLPLPPLGRVDYGDVSRTVFDLVVRADYARLEAAAIPALVGRRFAGTGRAAGTRVDITSFGLAGATEGVEVAIGFAADLPATRGATNGVLYLTARPVVDASAERISLADIRLAPVIDNRLWGLVGAVFEDQIVAEIGRRATFDLGEHALGLETMIAERLGDPARTGGLELDVGEVDVRLVELVPEHDALAAVARVAAELEVRVPHAALARPLGR